MIEAKLKVEVVTRLFPNDSTETYLRNLNQLEEKLVQLITDFCEQHKIILPNGSMKTNISLDKS